MKSIYNSVKGSGNPAGLDLQNIPSSFVDHINDASIHFLMSSINHTHIQNIATNTHPQIDSFVLSKGQSNGLASLDSTGKIPLSQLPSTFQNEVTVVPTIAARDALIASTGDVAKVLNDGFGLTKSYIWDGSTWIEITDQQDPIVSNIWRGGNKFTTSTDLTIFNFGISSSGPTGVTSFMSAASNSITISPTNVDLSVGFTSDSIGTTITTPYTATSATLAGPVSYGHAPATFPVERPFTSVQGITASVSLFVFGYLNCGSSTCQMPNFSSLPVTTTNRVWSVSIRNTSGSVLNITAGTNGSISGTASIPTGLTYRYHVYLTSTNYTMIYSSEYLDTGITSVIAFGTNGPNSNAATIVGGSQIEFDPADSTNPGFLSATAQSIGGSKTFQSIISNSGFNIGTAPTLLNSITPSAQTLILPSTVAGSGSDVLQINTINGSTASLIWTTQRGAVNTVGSPNTTSTANALTISNESLILHAGDSTNAGFILPSANQSFTGNKTFNTDLFLSDSFRIGPSLTFTCSPGSGYTFNFPSVVGTANQVLCFNGWNNPSIQSISAPGSSPNSSAATLSASGVLTLQPADATNPGFISIGAQTYAGTKTFNNQVTLQAGSINFSGGTSLSVPSSVPSNYSINFPSGLLSSDGLRQGLQKTSTDYQWASVTSSISNTETLNTAGALSLTTISSIITKSGTYTLADGIQGQKKYVIPSAPGIYFIVTTSNTSFTIINPSLLVYSGSSKWFRLS